MGNTYLLKELVPNLSPLFFEFKDTNYSRRLYADPEWMKLARIENSLEAMSQLILDEAIPVLSVYRRQSPFFIGTDRRKDSWGREKWTQDLGFFKYRPAYNSLREVWLHDLDISLSETAFVSLARLGDERTIDDLQIMFEKELLSYDAMYTYVKYLSHFNSDKAIRLIMDIADFARSLYNSEVLDENGIKEKTYIDPGASTDILSIIITHLGSMQTKTSEKAMDEIVSWFPYDMLINRRYGQMRELKELHEEFEETHIVLPKGYDEKVIGTEKIDIPF